MKTLEACAIHNIISKDTHYQRNITVDGDLEEDVDKGNITVSHCEVSHLPTYLTVWNSVIITDHILESRGISSLL